MVERPRPQPRQIVVPAIQPAMPSPPRLPVAPLPAVRGPVIPVTLCLMVLAALTIISLVAFF